MTEHDAFLAAIRESPDDDLPRLMYADWLTERGDPRGEFIRVQCEIASLNTEDPRRPLLMTRANSLLRRHGRVWRTALPRLRGVRWGGFERGFIGSATGSVRALLAALPTVLDAAPMAEIRIESPARGELKKLFASPHASRIHGLQVRAVRDNPASAAEVAESPHAAGLRSLTWWDVEADSLARVLVGSPHLSQLRRLDLSDSNFNDADAVALAESKCLGSLRSLRLAATELGSRGVEALAATTRFRLNELDLSDNYVGPGGIRALAEGAGLKELTRLTLGHWHRPLANCDELLATPHLPRLASLELNLPAATKWRAKVLASAPRGTALRRLVLCDADLEEDPIRRLAACPRLADLHELSLEDAGLGDAGLTALAASPFLADLRVLNLRYNQFGNKGAVALARGGWRRLEVVDLSANQIRDAGVKALLASPLGKHTSVLNLQWNKYRKAGREALRRRRVRAWPTTEEGSP